MRPPCKTCANHSSVIRVSSMNTSSLKGQRHLAGRHDTPLLSRCVWDEYQLLHGHLGECAARNRKEVWRGADPGPQEPSGHVCSFTRGQLALLCLGAKWDSKGQPVSGWRDLQSWEPSLVPTIRPWLCSCQEVYRDGLPHVWRGGYSSFTVAEVHARFVNSGTKYCKRNLTELV